ncbi:MAG: sugar transferase, partial [Planctomycetota bacterium]
MRPSKRQVLLLIWDLAILVAGVYLAYYFRTGLRRESPLSPLELYRKYTGATAFAVGVRVFVYYLLDLYNPTTRYTIRSTLKRILPAEAVAVLLVGALFYFFPNWHFGRGYLGIGAGFYLVALPLWRSVYSRWFQETAATRSTLILGDRAKASSFLEEVRKIPENPFHFVGIVDGRPEPGAAVAGVPVLSTGAGIGALVRENRASTVILAGSKSENGDLLPKILDLKLSGVEVLDRANAFKTAAKKLPLKYIDLNWLVDAAGFDTVKHPVMQRIHRLLDVGLSLSALSVSFPLLLLLAVLVKLTSRGPVFFRQERVGWKEKPFEILKLRTMVDGAEADSGP